jgi:DUF1680 family protein
MLGNTNVLDPVLVLRRSSRQEIRVLLECGGLTPLSFFVRFALCAMVLEERRERKAQPKRRQATALQRHLGSSVFKPYPVVQFETIRIPPLEGKHEMNRKHPAFAPLCAIVALHSVWCMTSSADPLTKDSAKIIATPVVPLQVYAFDLRDVRLLDGPFLHAQELNRRYLLSLDPDRLLHTFRQNAGLPSSAAPLGGWEAPDGELRGHFAGHYLTACALMFASTGDQAVKARAEAVVRGMAECQAKFPSGYLSAYPEEFFDRVESGRRVWAPYYTLHKIYAGLLDMYVYCDSTLALDVCKRMADWVIARNDRLSDEQMQRMLDMEHGGMNEVLADLYGLTGEAKYLKIAQRFNHMAVIEPAQQQQDRLTGLHANTQVPKFVGAARQYELTGDTKLQTAAKFFWDTVVNERSYVIGGHSDGEHFSPKERLSQALGPATTETCNTYNMLKLTRHLFCGDPRPEYADYYERALYNHILASQHPETGMMCYYVPLRSGSAKGGRGYGYNSPLDSFWCCTGTGIENHAKYGDSIYFHDGADTLLVNLFIASELRIPETGITVRQETRFPEEDTTRLHLTCDAPREGALKIRHPAWAVSGVTVTVNGVPQDIASQPGSYITLRRQWNSGDRVEVKLPFNIHTEGFRDNPDRFAFLSGPLVLCGEVDRAEALSGRRRVARRRGGLAAARRPAASCFHQSSRRLPDRRQRRAGECHPGTVLPDAWRAALRGVLGPVHRGRLEGARGSVPPGTGPTGTVCQVDGRRGESRRAAKRNGPQIAGRKDVCGRLQRTQVASCRRRLVFVRVESAARPAAAVVGHLLGQRRRRSDL